MTKELQDLAWSVLPKEFKEEVKETYKEYAEKIASKSEPEYRIVGYIAAQTELELLFGIHNLTSDAEGEEMLMVSRKRVQEFYAKCKEVTMNPYSYPDYSHESALSRMALLDILFGSKCLPDNVGCSEPNVDSSDGSVDSLEHLEPKANSDYTPIPEKTVVSKWDKTEPKPAEPKFHRGDAVIYQGTVYTIHDGDGVYILKNVLGYLKDGAVLEQDLEPYNGPKYHIGDKVRYLGQNREIGEIAAYYEDEPGRYSVLFGKEYHNIRESALEPYTEPKESNCTKKSDGSDQFRDTTKMVDDVITRGFDSHNRLHIASMAMQAILSRGKGYDAQEIAVTALECADALISECEKGGES